MRTFLFSLFLFLAGCNNSSNSQSYYAKDDIIKDIDVYSHGISLNHVNAFTKITKDSFLYLLEDCKKKSAIRNDDEVLVSLLKVNAKIQDEHTSIRFQNQKIFPYFPYWFKDGLFILRSDTSLKQIIYGNIIAINDIKIAEILKTLSEVLPVRNEGYIKYEIPNLLVSPAILHGSGIINNRDSLKLTVVTRSNDTILTTITAIRKDKLSPSKIDNFKGFLRYKKKENYWCYHDISLNYLYFKYNACAEMTDYPFKIFLTDILRELSNTKVEKLIIDVRDNMGGNEAIIFPLIEELKSYTRSHRLKIDVLIGRRTFSSAVLNVLDLKEGLNIRTIGESTGGSINHFGEINSFELPHSRLIINYSTKYFLRKKEEAGPLKPDVLIEENFADFIQGKDSALNFSILH